MKKLLLSLIIMVFAAQLSAQSLSFKYEGEVVESGETIDIVATDLAISPEVVFDLHIINTTDADINVVWEYNDTVNGEKIGTNYVCFGSCYGPTTTTESHTLAASAEEIFQGHSMFIDAEGNLLPVGTEIKIIYTLFDERNPEEKYVFNVNFKYEAAEVVTPALTFKYEGEAIEAGSTIDIVTANLAISPEVVFDLHIINTTDADINVVWEYNDTVNGEKIGTNYVCFGSCYGPTTTTESHTLAAGAEEIFQGHSLFIDAEGNLLPVGTEIKIVYTLFDERNPDEKYVFNVNFKYESKESIVDYNSVDVFSNAYPNPANNTVSFDYNMPFDVNSASVAIYNMMGQEVVRQDLNLGGSRVNFNVSDLNEGVYFYSLIINNQTVKTNKFVVSR